MAAGGRGGFAAAKPSTPANAGSGKAVPRVPEVAVVTPSRAGLLKSFNKHQLRGGVMTTPQGVEQRTG